MSPVVRRAVPENHAEVVLLRVIAEQVKARGDDGISALIYYAAELLERRYHLSLDIALAGIHEGERHT